MRKTLLLAASWMFLLPNIALAQQQNDISPNPIEGVSITSNSDNSPGEFIQMQDSGQVVFYADGDVQTNVGNDNNVTLFYDDDNDGSGTFAITTGGTNVLTANNAGTVTIQNAMITNGINNGTDGITNAGAISGVTTLGTSGLATLNSASVTNNATVGGTLGVTGNTTLSTVSTSGLATLNSASVTNNATVGGTFGVTGNTSLSTVSTSGLATLNSASVTNNATVGGTLGVTGNTTLSTVSTSGLATLNSASVTNNATVGGTLGVTGNTTLSTVSTSGLATLNSASVTNNATVGGTLGVTGNTTLSTVSTSGLATLNSASITNNATVGGTLGVTGATTLNGATAVNNTFSVDTNGAAAGGTRLTVDATAATVTSTNGNTSSTVNNNGHILTHFDGVNTNSVEIGATQTGSIGANTFDYGTTVNGGMLVEGDLGVNGSIYALNPAANSGINVGNNGLDINGATNTTSLIADGNNNAGDGRGAITLKETQASIYVYNQATGNAHGLMIDQTKAVLTGGTTSTSLTLDDNGATFQNTSTGGAATVTGVADGRSDFDAVNFRQLQTAHAGIASVAAMANVPQIADGKIFSLGMGYGRFEDQNAFAVGGQARVNNYINLKASVGQSNDNSTVGAGVGLSW